VHADALVIASADPLFGSRAEQLGALALRHRLPAIHQFRRFAVAGGLASYGGSFLDSYRQVGIYTGRILKGEKPADLPVQWLWRAAAGEKRSAQACSLHAMN
jgi:putative ABC transport system substrate-binding protein